MRICLTCRNASPTDAMFCLNCGRSFGSRICDKHHLSPTASRYCTSCGSPELSRSTRSVEFGCLLRIFACALTLLLFKLIISNFGFFCNVLFTITSVLFGFVSGVSLLSVIVNTVHFLIVILLLEGIVRILTRWRGRSLVVQGVLGLAKLVWPLVGATARSIRSIAFGSTKKGKTNNAEDQKQ